MSAAPERLLPAPTLASADRVPAARHGAFWAAAIAVGLCVALALRLLGQDYAWFAAYFVLQYVVLATGWNVLGGQAGYVNFGAAAFFATGAYTTVALGKWLGFGVLAAIPAAAVVGGLLGLATGWLTLRLRGAYFAIATLCLAVVLQTAVVNWDFVGGSRGAYVVPPRDPAPFASHNEYMGLLMIGLAVLAAGIARTVQHSRLGAGLAALRDDEAAAEAAGVPTLRLKLIACTLSGALLAVAGAPFPFHASFIEPTSVFGLAYAVNAIAMPVVGGTASWLGPVVGAVLLASLQQAATVTIASAANLLVVGVVLVGFVCLAPHGIVGLFRHR